MKILLCEYVQPSEITLSVDTDFLTKPQLSFTGGDIPSAFSISILSGLHPRYIVVSFTVNSCAEVSTIHCTVLFAVSRLPQESIAMKLLVCARIHPVVTILSFKVVIHTIPQLSSAGGAFPNPSSITSGSGLQPSEIMVSVKLNTGAVVSTNHWIVLKAVSVFPHESVAMNMLLCERMHPLTTMVSLVVEKFTIPQFSSTEGGKPNAICIAIESGLHPRFSRLSLTRKMGAMVSTNHCTVLKTVSLLPQESVAIKVLICVRMQPLVVAESVKESRCTMPQLSFADGAIPKAFSIST